MNHKAGFVNIIGKPNVGKSTLMNALVGEKLSIITSKAQTTRHRIMGIVNGDDFQIVYSDTPGIIEKPGYKLQESMMKFVESALVDADIFLFITEPADRNYSEEFITRISRENIPVLVLINKVDLSDQTTVTDAIHHWEQTIPGAKVMPVAALHKVGIEGIFDVILDLLPESPAYYDKEELTDKSMRFFVSEIIREQILVQFQKEIPYSVEVVVERYKEDEDPMAIDAIIYVERESQKAILIGHQGAAIKRMGTTARKEIEAFIGKHIYLDLRIKVNKEWREDPRQLKRFGYEQ
ncbi:MAG: GTPase Era [Bacteroidales bacterium]